MEETNYIARVSAEVENYLKDYPEGVHFSILRESLKLTTERLNSVLVVGTLAGRFAFKQGAHEFIWSVCNA